MSKILKNENINKHPKRGNALGFLFFAFLIRYFGLRSAYSLLYFVCIYYLIMDKSARKLARLYLEKRFPEKNNIQLLMSIYRLFVSQGKHLIDLYAMMHDSSIFEIEMRNFEDFKNLAAESSQGAILLTSHLGNWQLAIKGLNMIAKPINLLMKEEDNPAVKNYLSMDKNTNKIKIISPDQFLGGAIEITNALNQGEIVAIMGDRSYEADTLEVKLLNQKAYFPYSAFHIAATVQCPTVFLKTFKISHRRYCIDFGKTVYPKSCASGGKKKEQLQPYVQEYCNFFEEYVTAHPYQCFLFHDVWDEKN